MALRAPDSKPAHTISCGGPLSLGISKNLRNLFHTLLLFPSFHRGDGSSQVWWYTLPATPALQRVRHSKSPSAV